MRLFGASLLWADRVEQLWGKHLLHSRRAPRWFIAPRWQRTWFTPHQLRLHRLSGVGPGSISAAMAVMDRTKRPGVPSASIRKGACLALAARCHPGPWRSRQVAYSAVRPATISSADESSSALRPTFSGRA